jgi:hypothetical protein
MFHETGRNRKGFIPQQLTAVEQGPNNQTVRDDNEELGVKRRSIAECQPELTLSTRDDLAEK